jgi:catechol 2,3-dioxygenase-like lactoylglutathione lyase family enzyme
MTPTRTPLPKIRLQHVSLPIPDGAQETVRAFYGGVLGLKEKKVPRAVAHHGFVWFAVGADNLELHFIPDRLVADPEEGRHVCLEVEDLELYRCWLVEAGRQPFETFPVPNRRRFFCRDPLGILIEFATPPRHLEDPT